MLSSLLLGNDLYDFGLTIPEPDIELLLLALSLCVIAIFASARRD